MTAVLYKNRQKVCKHLIEGLTKAAEVRLVWDTFLRVLEGCKDVSSAIIYAYDSLSVPALDTSSMRA
jgi:hypothetical protein